MCDLSIRFAAYGLAPAVWHSACSRSGRSVSAPPPSPPLRLGLPADGFQPTSPCTFYLFDDNCCIFGPACAACVTLAFLAKPAPCRAATYTICGSCDTGRGRGCLQGAFKVRQGALQLSLIWFLIIYFISCCAAVASGLCPGGSSAHACASRALSCALSLASKASWMICVKIAFNHRFDPIVDVFCAALRALPRV